MKVLVVESESGGGDAARRALAGAGLEIVECDTFEPHAPCRGLAAVGECPLDDGDVDVAVVHHTGRELTASERGALCAARRRVPVVVDGDYRRSVSFGPGTHIAGSDLVGACREAARSGAAHSSAIRRDLLCSQVVGPEEVVGEHPQIEFAVERSPNRLRLTVTVPEGHPRSANVVNAAAESLRRFDPWAPVIDVRLERRPGCATDTPPC